MAARHAYFAIFGSMRTGSNLLERTLDQYEGLRAEGELFNSHFIGKPKRREYLGLPLAERNADPVGFLGRLLAGAEGRIPGFRIFDGHDARMIDFAARDPRCAKIILRRSPLDSFVSLQIAQETGQWMLMKEENRRLTRIRFDPAAFEAYREGLEAHYDRIRRAMLAAGQTFAEVRYEELGDLDIINGLAAMIGSPEAKTAMPEKIQRQNPVAWEDRVENAEELRAYHARAALGPPPDPDPEPQPRFGALDALVASRNYDLIYAPIPGAGEGALRRFVTEAARVEGAEAPTLVEGLQAQHLDRRRRRGGFVFTFIRHPAARLHDVFMRRIARRAPGAFEDVQMLLARDYRGPGPEEMADSEEARAAGFDAFLGFIEDNLAGRTALRVDPAWTPQSTLIARYAEETPIDFIGRFDRLARDAAYVLERAGASGPALDLPAKLEAHLARFTGDWPIERWLTKEREQRLMDIYARDYARLGFGKLTRQVRRAARERARS